MKPHIFHVRDPQTRRTWWVIGDGMRSMRAAAGESMNALVQRWSKTYGKPAAGYVRVTGFCRPSEAAAQLASMHMEAAAVRRCRVCGCTEDDCSQCVEATGEPCAWVEGEDPPICTRCADAADAALVREMEGGAS